MGGGVGGRKRSGEGGRDGERERKGEKSGQRILSDPWSSQAGCSQPRPPSPSSLLPPPTYALSIHLFSRLPHGPRGAAGRGRLAAPARARPPALRVGRGPPADPPPGAAPAGPP